MKGDEAMPLLPLFVRKDESILSHSFLVVMEMLLWRLTWKRTGRRGSRLPGRGDGGVGRTRLVLVRRQKRGELKGGEWKLSDHGVLAGKLFEKLKQGGEIPA